MFAKNATTVNFKQLLSETLKSTSYSQAMRCSAKQNFYSGRIKIELSDCFCKYLAFGKYFFNRLKNRSKDSI